MRPPPARHVADVPRPRARGHLGRAEIAISARGASRDAGQGFGPLHDLSLDVIRGEITVICGSRGAGKTALLRLLAGLDRPDAGTVWIGERRVGPGRGRPAWRFRRDQLAFVGAGDTASMAGSGRGEAIMRALAPNPEFAFVDEPAAGLGPAELDRVHAFLYALTRICGRTAVVATADPEVASWGSRLLVLERGSLVRDLDAPTPVEARSVVEALRGGVDEGAGARQ